MKRVRGGAKRSIAQQHRYKGMDSRRAYRQTQQTAHKTEHTDKQHRSQTQKTERRHTLTNTQQHRSHYRTQQHSAQDKPHLVVHNFTTRVADTLLAAGVQVRSGRRGLEL